MSDNQNQMQMPAAPSAGGAPGQYPPLNIPQSTQEANAMTDAMNNNGNGLNSPGSAGGPRRAAPEPNKRALYVGGLDPRVTEEVLKQIFETTGHVQSVKIIPDKNVSLARPTNPPPILHIAVVTAFVTQQSWLP
jgi:nucleolysin TIA-1/TIAR